MVIILYNLHIIELIIEYLRDNIVLSPSEVVGIHYTMTRMENLLFNNHKLTTNFVCLSTFSTHQYA